MVARGRELEREGRLYEGDEAKAQRAGMESSYSTAWLLRMKTVLGLDFLVQIALLEELQERSAWSCCTL